MDNPQKQDQSSFDNNVRYFPKVVPLANNIFQQLKDQVNWQVIPWSTGRNLPRLCCHSVQQYPVGKLVQTWITKFFYQTMGVKINIVDIFGNNYRNGNDYLPDHTDQYSDGQGAGLHVASVSFGATRLFRFSKGKVLEPKFYLEQGDLIIFSPQQNATTKHGIPKQPQIKDVRINLTCFFEIVSGNPYKALYHSADIPILNGAMQPPLEAKIGRSLNIEDPSILAEVFAEMGISEDNVDPELMAEVFAAMPTKKKELTEEEKREKVRQAWNK